ncbi:hypothetical protein, partial [uncultured Paraburkholderia sp.]|uniref:hypothetical protein n=1 Tax=uncultured Paraburkholderia sp. TaxID=1822466 RepID=UPI002592DF60
GSCWKIGNGNRVRIWEDPWLTGCQWRKLFSTKPATCDLMKVKKLLNPRGEGWNKELLNQLFSEEEKKAILNIPVSSLGLKDRLIWQATKDGQYTVASGYKWAKKKQKQER